MTMLSILNKEHKMTSNELKPMGLGSILDKTFKITFFNFKKNFKLFLIFIGILILLLILIGIIIFAVYFFNRDLFENISNASNVLKIFIFTVPLVLIITLISAVIGIFYTGMIYDVFIKAFTETEWNIKTSFSFIKKKFWTIFFSGLLTSLILIGGYLMCFIGIYPMIIFTSLVLPAVLYENKGIGDSISRSFKLVSYSFWYILGYMFVFNLIISAVITFVFYFLMIPLVIFISFFQNNYQSISFIAGISIIGLLCSIIFIIMMVIYYALHSSFSILIFFNQKIKFENYGVEIMTESLINDPGILADHTDQKGI
jgi:hypothetical protein